MASPPQVQSPAVLLRTPQQFRDLGEVNRWAKGLLRALELQNTSAGVKQGTDIQEPTSYPYTAQSTDYIILVDTTAARTIRLPKMTKGFLVGVKDATGGAGGNNITINPDGAEVINGAPTHAIAAAYGHVLILGTGIAGNEWLIIG